MMYKALLATALVVGSTAPTMAQTEKSKWIDTRFEQISKSLEDLLNGGFEIVSGSRKTDYLLRLESSDGFKYVTCIVDQRGGYGDVPQSIQSNCVRLN